MSRRARAGEVRFTPSAGAAEKFAGKMRPALLSAGRSALRRLSTASTLRAEGLSVIDCHAGGEPARIVVGGLPHVPGDTVAAKREHLMAHMDGLRKLLLHEPRGYPCQNANFIVPSAHPDAAYGFVIAEQHAVYPMMSGHNAICVATALLESGMVVMAEPTTTFHLEAPCGLIRVDADCAAGRVTRVTLHNQPAYCMAADRDVVVDVPHHGKVRVDVAYGGMFYAIVDAEDVGLAPLGPSRGREICRLGEMIKVAAREQHPVRHPTLDYVGPDILVFREPYARLPCGGLRARNGWPCRMARSIGRLLPRGRACSTAHRAARARAL